MGLTDWANKWWGQSKYGLGQTIDTLGRASDNIFSPGKDYGVSERLMGIAHAAEPGVAGTRTVDPNTFTPLNQPPQQSTFDSSDYTNNTGGGTTQVPAYQQVFNGQLYTSPSEYTNAVNNAALTEYQKVQSNLKKSYDAGLISLEDYERQLARQREDIKTRASQLHKQFQDTTGQGYANISGRFSALSPEALQSAQGAAEQKFAGNLADLQTANTTEINRANEDLAQAEATLLRQRQDLPGQYEETQRGNQSAYQNQIDSTINQTLANLADTQYANEMGAINRPVVSGPNTLDYTLSDAFKGLSDTYLKNQQAGLSSAQNQAAIKTQVDALPVEQTIKDWLYTRFSY